MVILILLPLVDLEVAVLVILLLLLHLMKVDNQEHLVKEIQVDQPLLQTTKEAVAVVVLVKQDKMLDNHQVLEKLETVEMVPILMQLGTLQHPLVSQVILQVVVAVVMDQVLESLLEVLVVVDRVVKTNPQQDLDLQTLVVEEEAVGIMVLLPTDLVDLVWF